MFSHIRSIYKRYTLQELANHPAIVILPYAVMSYSIVEFYAINLPMFVPSIEFLYELNLVEDRTLQSINCHHMPDPITLSKQKNVNISSHAYSPNSEEYSAFSYWLQYADYYQWPFVTVFDSYEDLFTKLKNVDLKRISEKMKLTRPTIKQKEAIIRIYDLRDETERLMYTDQTGRFPQKSSRGNQRDVGECKRNGQCVWTSLLDS